MFKEIKQFIPAILLVFARCVNQPNHVALMDPRTNQQIEFYTFPMSGDTLNLDQLERRIVEAVGKRYLNFPEGQSDHTYLSVPYFPKGEGGRRIKQWSFLMPNVNGNKVVFQTYERYSDLYKHIGWGTLLKTGGEDYAYLPPEIKSFLLKQMPVGPLQDEDNDHDEDDLIVDFEELTKHIMKTCEGTKEFKQNRIKELEKHFTYYQMQEKEDLQDTDEMFFSIQEKSEHSLVHYFTMLKEFCKEMYLKTNIIEGDEDKYPEDCDVLLLYHYATSLDHRDLFVDTPEECKEFLYESFLPIAWEVYTASGCLGILLKWFSRHMIGTKYRDNLHRLIDKIGINGIDDRGFEQSLREILVEEDHQV